MTSEIPSSHPGRQLPNEIMDQIIDHVVPAKDIRIVALESRDITTRTLLALSRTCRATYEPAVRLLYRHCLYICSFEKLALLTTTLQLPQNAVFSPSSSRPQMQIAQYATSLYLAPFPTKTSTFTQMHQIYPLCTFLELLAPYLKRFILSLPRNCDEHFEVLLPTLRNLTSLEFFGSTHDNLKMLDDSRSGNPKELFAWTSWPNLRVLGLNLAYPHLDVWRSWGELDKLERVMLANTDGNSEVWEAQYLQGQVELGRDAETAKKLAVDILDGGGGWLSRPWPRHHDDALLVDISTPRGYCPGDRVVPYKVIQKWFTKIMLAGFDKP